VAANHFHSWASSVDLRRTDGESGLLRCRRSSGRVRILTRNIGAPPRRD
jgi:hypothetical protein